MERIEGVASQVRFEAGGAFKQSEVTGMVDGRAFRFRSQPAPILHEGDSIVAAGHITDGVVQVLALWNSTNQTLSGSSAGVYVFVGLTCIVWGALLALLILPLVLIPIGIGMLGYAVIIHRARRQVRQTGKPSA